MTEDRRVVSDEQALLRICSEYLEMPGLRLTARQAQRLFGLAEHRCVNLLDELVGHRFLKRHANGMYVRRGEGPEQCVRVHPTQCADELRETRMIDCAAGGNRADSSCGRLS